MPRQGTSAALAGGVCSALSALLLMDRQGQVKNNNKKVSALFMSFSQMIVAVLIVTGGRPFLFVRSLGLSRSATVQMKPGRPFLFVRSFGFVARRDLLWPWLRLQHSARGRTGSALRRTAASAFALPRGEQRRVGRAFRSSCPSEDAARLRNLTKGSRFPQNPVSGHESPN